MQSGAGCAARKRVHQAGQGPFSESYFSTCRGTLPVSFWHCSFLSTWGQGLQVPGLSLALCLQAGQNLWEAAIWQLLKVVGESVPQFLYLLGGTALRCILWSLLRISVRLSGTFCIGVFPFLASLPHSPCRISWHHSPNKLSSEFASGDTHARALTPQAPGRREWGREQRVRHALFLRGSYACRGPNQNVDVEEGTGCSLLH